MKNIALALTALLAADFQKAGPLKIDERVEGSCTVFAPAPLTGGHPVILWGNGTGAKVSSYRPILRHLASHGFVAVAANTSEAGTGAEMIACLDQVSKSPIASGLDLTKVGAAGHSQGAWGAIQAGRDPRIKATAPINPGGGNVRMEAVTAQKAPMLLLSAGADRVAPPERAQALIYRAARTPVTWATIRRAGHLDAADDPAGRYREALTAWFLWRLKGDEDAATMLEGSGCGLCENSDWKIEFKV